jgi:probable F420-dependent oxidoreductase
MKLGIFNINNFACSYPEGLARVARTAEAAGFESAWTGEHVVLPDPQVPPSPVAPEGRMLDPAVALAFAAAHTSTLRLGTGIIILPQRNPLVLAKELASVDVLSGGRMIFGVGVGYLKPEFDALGISMEDRGTRTLEYIEAMRAIWAGDKAAYHGRYVDYEGVSANPKPVQPGGIPVVMGGHTPAAWRKSVTHCQGWYGFALDHEATQRNLDGLTAAAAKHPRGAGLGELEISVTPRGRVDRAAVDRFAEMGVYRLVLIPRGEGIDAICGWIEDTADTLLR